MSERVVDDKSSHILLGEAKVRYLHVVVHGNQNILALEIPVTNFKGVKVLEPQTYLAGPDARLIFCDGTVF